MDVQNPLLGRFDIDPSRWKPMFYGVEISVGREDGQTGMGSINLNNQPYILTRITHRIIGCIKDPDVTGRYQQGQYTIAFRDEESNYQNIPIQAELMFGKSESGDFMDLPYPIAYSGNKTLTFEITNRCTMVFEPEADYFILGICLAGVADWGKVVPTPKGG